MAELDFGLPKDANGVNRNAQQPNLVVVGLGASAGGVQTLKDFFEATPADSGIAYVVILHLSPNHDSQLAQVLQGATTMPVIQIRERTQIEPNKVYVIPPDKHLTMEDRNLAVTSNLDLADRRAPVDIFFRSLAESHDAWSVGVVLSGTGANGSMGLKRIKERGGAVFVQNPREATFSEMPRNAIATNLVDDILNVADIPKRLIAYRDSLHVVHTPEALKDRDENDQEALRTVLTELRLRTGHDFSNYKRPTLLRRIERRIHLRVLAGLPAYADYIIQYPEETHALLKDLLISVTNFFRDKTPFEELERDVLPKILRDKKAEDHLRIWVAGCATGEEAYSIAMICADLTLGLVDAPKVQIFATDIDEAAIATAREGFYTLNDAADVPQERLNRYFIREGEGFYIRRELRETILFANHNFIKDSPFSRLDLVICRNVLIYLNRVAQERVFETFYFALKAGGFLLLGTSESVDGASNMFTVYSREQHIWQSWQVRFKNIIVPEGIPRMKLPRPPVKDPPLPSLHEQLSFGELHHQMVELYAPPSLIVNEEFDVVHTSEHAARYLSFTAGEPMQKLLKLVPEELRAELRNALYGALQRKAGVSALGLKMRMDNRTQTLNIHVRPMPENSPAPMHYFMLVVFEPVSAQTGEVPVVVTNDESATRHLEEEVIRLKAQLRGSNEQHEFAAEEMKAGNEELQAMNEELRSASEELETSKEELQSINEELSTVNQELKVRVEESNMTSNNLRNIINSTDIGTIFLDRSFRVVLFTPAACSVFNLIPADHGRSLSDITSKLANYDLLEDARMVLEHLQRIEREAHTTNGCTLIVRLAPYRTEDDRIQGVVISLVDITERRKADEALRLSEEKYRTLFSSIDEGYNLMEMLYDEAGYPIDFRILETNPAFARITGIEGAAGKMGRELVPTLEPLWVVAAHRVVQTGRPERFEDYIVGLDKWFSVYLSRMDGPRSGLVVSVFNDITERKRREANLAVLAEISTDFERLASEAEIMQSIGKRLARHLRLDGFNFCDVDEKNGMTTVKYVWNASDVPQHAGTYRIVDYMTDDFIRAMRAGEIWVVHDTATDERVNAEATAGIGLGAYLVIPYHRQGEWCGVFTASARTARDWKADEIALIEEVSNRTFPGLERARAEDALRLLMEQLEGQVKERTATLNKTAEELQNNLAILQQAENLAGIGSWEYEFNTRSFTWSNGMYQLFSMSQGTAVVPEIYVQAAVPEDCKPAEQLANNIRTGMLPLPDIISIKAGDAVKVLKIEATVVKDEQGKPVRMIGVDMDVTATRQAEKTLSEQAHFIRSTNEALPDILYVLDLHTKNILYINHTFEERLGYPAKQDESPDESILDLIYAEDVPGMVAHYEELEKAADGQVCENEYRIKAADGNIHWFRDRNAVFKRDKSGVPIEKIGIAQDITVRKKAEQELKESNISLRYANESLQQFATIASHDLQEPLRKLRMFASVLQRFKWELPEEGKELLVKIQATSGRMSQLIREVLQYSKIAYGIKEFVATDLDVIWKNVLGDLELLLTETGAAIEYNGTLPQIKAIPLQMNQLLYNLLTNALKFRRPDAKPVIRISVMPVPANEVHNYAELYGNREYIKILFSDNGIGFDAQFAEQIFEIFERLHSVDEYEGTGVGLALCKKIVENHNGHIFATSEEGAGALFTIILPSGQ